jgi:hypothetical protein
MTDIAENERQLGDDEQEYQWAKHHAETKVFGRVKDLLFPFSSQLFAEIRNAFGVIDKSVYDDADAARAEVERDYATMRLATFALFVVFSFFSYGLTALHVGATSANPIVGAASVAADIIPIDHSSLLLTLGVIAAVAIVCGLIRSFVRSTLFREIDHRTETFAASVFIVYQNALNRVTEACSNAQEIGQKWPERAVRWVYIAIWHGERSEYLDRYSTATAWKIRTFISNVETASWLAKASLGAVTAYAILGSGLSLSSIAIVIAYLAIGVLVWFIEGRRSNDFWTDEFTEAIAKAVAANKIKTDHKATVAHLAGNLVKGVMANQRSTASKVED